MGAPPGLRQGNGMNRRVWSRGPALSLNQRQHKERECGHLQHHSATRPHRQFRTQKGYTSLTRSVTSRYPMVRPAGTPLRPHFGPRVAVRLRWEDRMLREAKQQERRPYGQPGLVSRKPLSAASNWKGPTYSTGQHPGPAECLRSNRAPCRAEHRSASHSPRTPWRGPDPHCGSCCPLVR